MDTSASSSFTKRNPLLSAYAFAFWQMAAGSSTSFYIAEQSPSLLTPIKSFKWSTT